MYSSFPAFKPLREQERRQLAAAFDGMRVFRPPGFEQLDQLLSGRLVVPAPVTPEQLQEMLECARLVVAGGEREREVKATLVVGRIGRDPGLEVRRIARLAGLASKLDCGDNPGPLAYVAFVRRDERGGLLGGVKAAGL